MKNGAPEGKLYFLSATSLPAVSLKALSATCSKSKQGKRGVWTATEPGKGRGKSVYP